MRVSSFQIVSTVVVIAKSVCVGGIPLDLVQGCKDRSRNFTADDSIWVSKQQMTKRFRAIAVPFQVVTAALSTAVTELAYSKHEGWEVRKILCSSNDLVEMIKG